MKVIVSCSSHWSKRILAAFVVLSGVATASVGASGAATRPPAIRHGGSVTFTTAGFFATMDPAINNMTNFNGAQNLQAVFGPGLNYVNPTTGALELGQAQSITGSKNGKVWTVVLHPHMKFSDGTAFNAAAVCNQISHDADPASGSKFTADAAKVSCRATNATTAKMSLTAPNFYFPAIISQDFAYISSPTALAAEGNVAFGSKPVGAGPFVLASTILGVSQTYTANPYYKLFAPGQPYLSSITMEASGSLSQINAALQSGQAQISTPINTQYATEQRAAGMVASMHSTAGGAYLALNTSKPPFNNVLARQAVYDVINRAGAANVWAPGNPLATNLFPTTSPFFNKKYNFPAGQPSKAQAIFNQLAAQGDPVNFTITWPNTTATAVPSYIQSLFAGMANVTVGINLVAGAESSADQLDGNFQMCPQGLYNNTLIPAVQQTFETGGNLNYMRWSDPKADAALQGLYTDRTVAKQTKDWDALQTELNTQVPVIWLQQGRIGTSYNANAVGGIKAVEFGDAILWGSVYLK